MIAMSIYIERKGWPAASSADLRASTEQATRASALAWHSGILPVHFTPAAASRYGYKPRTRAYMLKKARRKGNQNPLEWSGSLKREMTRRAEIRRTQGGVTLKMYGRALNFSGKVVKRAAGKQYFGQSRYPNMVKETTSTTQQEETALARVARRSATASLRELRATKIRKV